MVICFQKKNVLGYVFFFQAEDGIRDKLVTGVQTCALPISAHLEAVGVQQVGGGGEHVRHRVAQIDAAVAVEIDAVLDVGRRQKLRLPDFAGIGADQVAQGKIAALHDLQR